MAHLKRFAPIVDWKERITMFARSFKTSGTTIVIAAVFTLGGPTAAAAQDQPAIPATPPAASATQAATPAPTDPNPGAFTLTGSVDFLNQYMFRGIRQNSTGLVIWPAFDVGVAAYSGNGGLKSVGINLGSWNSLHTGDTGADGPSAKLWYESDFYTTLTLGFGGGVSVATTYTAYTSPNSGFSNVKEFMFKLAVDDSAHLGKAALKPYVIIAREFDTASGVGQADGGEQGGHVPGARHRARLCRLQGEHRRAGQSRTQSRQLLRTDRQRQHVRVLQHRGHRDGSARTDDELRRVECALAAEFQKLGDTTTSFNGGHSTQVIGSFGIGFTY